MNAERESAESSPSRVCVQIAIDAGLDSLPGGVGLVREAAELALPAGDAECTVRVVGIEESRSLNLRHRGRDRPTNVLAFPMALSPELAALLPDNDQSPPLGDIAVCLDVARREAREQDKALENHLTHLIVHGVLHLRGFDHNTEAEALAMEALERELLARQSIADPYQSR